MLAGEVCILLYMYRNTPPVYLLLVKHPDYGQSASRPKNIDTSHTRLLTTVFEPPLTLLRCRECVDAASRANGTVLMQFTRKITLYVGITRF